MFIAAANWKMNKAPAEVAPFFKELSQQLKTPSEVVVFPPALLASEVSKNIPKNFSWGLQNFHYEKSGAFTGENSLEVAQKMGATWCLVGHSERRSLFGESDELCAKKLKFAQSLGVRAMLCLGETLQERDAGKTNAVIGRQLEVASHGANSQLLAIAYEPVWAIGTGRVAEPQQVMEAHQFLRERASAIFSSAGARLPILYGGSVNAKNAAELSKIKNVDGFLVGGASLKADSFSPIASIQK